MTSEGEEQGPLSWRRYARREWQRLRLLLGAGDGPDADQVRADLDEARQLVLALFPDEQLE